MIPTRDPAEDLGRLARAVMDLDRCVLLVRHGQTDWNVADRLTTRTDVPLNARGHEQALELQGSLRGARFDQALASPLQRARVTGEVALSASVTPPRLVLDDRLREPDAGPFEGRVFADLQHGGAGAAEFAAYQDEVHPVFPAGSETLEQSRVKVRSLLDEVCALPGRTFVATHGALLRILVCEFLGAPVGTYRRYKISNCGGVLLNLYPQPPHQLAGLNLLP